MAVDRTRAEQVYEQILKEVLSRLSNSPDETFQKDTPLRSIAPQIDPAALTIIAREAIRKHGLEPKTLKIVAFRKSVHIGMTVGELDTHLVSLAGEEDFEPRRKVRKPRRPGRG